MATPDENKSAENHATEQFASRLNGYQQRVNTLLAQQIERTCIPGETLTEAMNYAVLSGGKRLRPLFT